MLHLLRVYIFISDIFVWSDTFNNAVTLTQTTEHRLIKANVTKVPKSAEKSKENGIHV